MHVYQILSINRIFLGTWLFLIITAIGLSVTAEQASSRPLIVTTKAERPYVMLRDPSQTNLKGNDRFEGFLVDLLQHLARLANFTYEISLVHDNQYGIHINEADHTFNFTGWTGMIGELVERKADLALGALTITEERMRVVDFTEPYWRTGVTIVVKKQRNQPVPFNDFEGLANQTHIQYGFISAGSTYSFFQNSILEPYKTMFAHVSAHPENLVRDYYEGIERVRNSNGSYAFILEKTAADYVTARVRSPCDITSVGEVNHRGYGIALPKNSPWTKRLSSLITQLKSDGTIQELFNVWWFGHYGNC